MTERQYEIDSAGHARYLADRAAAERELDTWADKTTQLDQLMNEVVNLARELRLDDEQTVQVLRRKFEEAAYRHRLNGRATAFLFARPRAADQPDAEEVTLTVHGGYYP